MATGRAYWKGYLKLSLVTCPVALLPATSLSVRGQPGASDHAPAWIELSLPKQGRPRR